MTELEKLQKANDEELAKINKQLEDIRGAMRELITIMAGNKEDWSNKEW